MKPSLSVGQIAQVALTLEATARKPGNVHRFRDFDDVTYLDFVLSAAALGPVLDRSGELGLGQACLEAVQATRLVSMTNTNLGMILLLVPLAMAPPGETLRTSAVRVVQTSTVEDARKVYEAIRLANPGGLGTSPEQDVAGEPTATLLGAMRLAEDRDLIARQYARGFVEVFETALPPLSGPGPVEDRVVTSHLHVLAARPDTLIARKRGLAEAAEASRMAAAILAAGWPVTKEARARFEEFDAWLRADGHGRNPGASADVVAAALFAALRDGTIQLPISPGDWSSSSTAERHGAGQTPPRAGC